MWVPNWIICYVASVSDENYVGSKEWEQNSQYSTCGSETVASYRSVYVFSYAVADGS